MNNKCICVLCNSYNSVNTQVIKRLKLQIQNYKNDTDLWLLFNTEETNPNKEDYKKFINDGYNVWIFTFRDIQKKYPLNFFLQQKNAFENTKYFSGNIHWPMLEFFQHIYYDYYMFYEDDAVYTGNINQLYDQALTEKHDIYFLQPFEQRSYECNNWIWTESGISNVPKQYFNKFSIIYSHIICLYITTYDNFKKILNNIIQYEWMGHHEMILPCLSKFLNFDIKFLDNKLTFCFQEFDYWKNKFQFLLLKQMDIKNNSFFHPIKELETYNKLIQ